MTDTDLLPITSDIDNDEPQLTHITRSDESMRGYIEGHEIRALCGFEFVPTRDPNRYPICVECKSILEMINSNGSN